MATVYYTATSLDGFLATPDDSVAFLDEVPQPSEDTYTPFFAGVGAICMGSSTYQFLQAHVAAGNDWPYPDHPVWVFSSRELEPVPGAELRFVSGDVAPHHQAMVDAAAGKDVWVCGGGGLAAAFLKAGLLDELVITVAARALGAGKPLLPTDAKLKLTSAQMLGAGFAELRLVPQ